MKERGKAVETYNHAEYNYNNYYSSSSDDLPCKKHPSSSSVGICAHCLKDRLTNLVCSDCGEQRLSSCSCSEVSSSYRNSCAAAEVGSVGRISILIENETKQYSHSKPKSGGVRSDEQVVLLNRSSSTSGCVGVKKRSGFWRIVRLFRKKKDKGCSERRSTTVGELLDDRSEMWVFDYMGGGVSRSRSLCSFRGGSFYDPEDHSDFAFSSAKVSDVNERLSGFSEAEPRKSGLKSVLEGESGLNGTNRSVFPVKESDFSRMDGSGFIDLKLDLSSSSESKPEFSVVKTTTSDLSVSSVSDHLGSLRGDTGIKKDKKGHKVWRWILKHHPNWKSSASMKDENDHVLY